MTKIEKYFVKYSPWIMFMIWGSLIMDHMMRGLNWIPLTVLLIPLIGLIFTVRNLDL